MPLRLISLLLATSIFSGCVVFRGSPSDPIPSLNTKGDVYKTEGANDTLIYDDALDHKRMVMLYLDFAESAASQSTEERAAKVVGEGQFQQLFHAQSYGKLTIAVEHVPGWRRLPKPRRAYGTKTTDAHRALFVDVFALYPEVDLRDYDYIVANIAALGNVAFGERDALAIPYRGGKIRTALNIASGSVYVLAHETAHLMGLPDLYTYGGVEGPRNPAGAWDIMSGRASKGFLGWHRHKLQWLGPSRKAYFTSGRHHLELTPLSADSGLSMVVVPADDPAHPSKVFVAEVSQREPGGIVIYSVDATLETGQNPVIVYPRCTLKEAAFHPGHTFADSAAPMELSVGKLTADGVYHVELWVR
ncbi:MAG: M6 family metalloprotease-like protein [Rhodothermales bacterium]|jgi:M6 family metalloprotease-like protein